MQVVQLVSEHWGEIVLVMRMATALWRAARRGYGGRVGSGTAGTGVQAPGAGEQSCPPVCSGRRGCRTRRFIRSR